MVTNMTSPFRKRDKTLPTRKGARKLAQWGHGFYWTAIVLAIVILATTIIFAVLDKEPLFQRVASVFVLGVIPAVLIWGAALVICSLLKEAGSLYNWTATARFPWRSIAGLQR